MLMDLCEQVLSNGKKHDFKLFKEGIKEINTSKKVIADTQGIKE
jgi:hypothetical protein